MVVRVLGLMKGTIAATICFVAADNSDD